MFSIDYSFCAWLLFYWQIFLLDLYLRYRQYTVHLRCVKRPDKLAEIVSSDDYDKARLYNLHKHRFAFVQKLCQGIGTMAVLLFNPSDRLADFSNQISQEWIADKGTVWQGSYHLAVFFGIYMTVHLFLQAPFAYYEKFIIEQKYGFKNKSVSEFITSEIFSLAFCIAAFTVAPVLLVWIMVLVGEHEFFNFWMSICAGIFVTVAAYPNFAAFLSTRHSTLPDCALKNKLTALALRMEFPLCEIYLTNDTSRDIETFGTWNKKNIALFDELVAEEETMENNIGNLDSEDGNDSVCSTCHSYATIATQNRYAALENYKEDQELISLCSCSENSSHSNLLDKSIKWTDKEVVALVARELAHWKLGHNIVYFLNKQVKTLFWLVAMSVIFYPKESFDGSVRLNSFLSTQVLSACLQIVLCHFSRRMEFSADRLASSLGYSADLCSALLKLEKQKKHVDTLLVDDPLYSSMNHFEPTTMERIDALKKYE